MVRTAAPSHSDDGRLDVKLSSPGGPGAGSNPEQLFAAGWSACFLSAIKLVAGKKKISLPAGVAIDAEVDLGTTHGVLGLAARLNISLPGRETPLSAKSFERHVLSDKSLGWLTLAFNTSDFRFR